MNELQVVGFLNWITQDELQLEYASLNGSPKGFWLGDRYVVDEDFQKWAECWLTQLGSSVSQSAVKHLSNRAMDKVVQSGNVWPPQSMIHSDAHCD